LFNNTLISNVRVTPLVAYPR